MIAKTELKRIAAARLLDAEALVNAQRLDGAVYLCGYAVEIALKARICETLNWSDFPETSNEFRGLSSFKTHDFNTLLRLSGIEDVIKTSYLTEWSMLKPWKPELRYAKTGTASRATVLSMISAAKTILGIL